MDGRSDSPSYSAKYGTYSLMNTDINKIVDFFVVHVSTAGNSSRMEKKGLQTLLERLNNIKFTTLTTDRHIQIRAFLKKEYPDILHQFDVWHFGKSIKKNLSSISKKKENENLGKWIKAIVNHLWWCCASGNGDVNILREKWLSILYHIMAYTSERVMNFFINANMALWNKRGNGLNWITCVSCCNKCHRKQKHTQRSELFNYSIYTLVLCNMFIFRFYCGK